MTDLVEALESIAERGTPRGPGAVLDAARRDVRARSRTKRHGLLIAAGVLLVAGLSAAAGVLALRSEPGNRVVTTPGPDGGAANRSLADPTVDCVFERGDRRSTAAIDPTLVPSSVSTELDDQYRVVVSVLPATDAGASGEDRVLRADVYGPEVPGTGQRNEALPDGVIFRIETGPRRPGDLIAFAGGGVGGLRAACDNARSRYFARLGDAAAAEPASLSKQSLAIGGSVQTPAGWVLTASVPGGSSMLTTFADPADEANRYVVSTNGSLGSWYEVNGVPGSITPLVPEDARASLVQFGRRSWRYERPSPDSSRVTVGAWMAILDPTTKQPSTYIVGEITVAKNQQALADSVVFALFFDYDRN